jgi:aryl-alcohol dehydrogenase-like predicted oxidoreductase
VTVDEIDEAARITPIASVQNMYNLTERGHARVIDHTAARGIAFVPYFPVSGGEHAPLAEVAAELGATTAQAALARLLHRAPNVIPIPDTSSPAQLAENVAALELELTEEQFKHLAG